MFVIFGGQNGLIADCEELASTLEVVKSRLDWKKPGFILNLCLCYSLLLFMVGGTSEIKTKMFLLDPVDS